MKKALYSQGFVVSALLGLAFNLASATSALAQIQPKLSDAQIRQILIDDTRRSYSGPCPCPYNTMRAGHACGDNSAYSKPGGAIRSATRKT